MNGRLGTWVSTSKASAFYGVSKNTIRRWSDNNSIEYKRKPSNQRIFFIPSSNNKADKNQTKNTIKSSPKSYVYCRVSSYKQKDDLDRQCSLLCSQFPNHELIKDIGSGLNYKRKGLLRLIQESNQGNVKEIVVSSKDRLCRFGFELLEWIFLQNNTELMVLEQIDKSPEQEFTEDILAILQVFACRWNGKRRYISKSQKNQIEVNSSTKENI